MRWTKTAIFCSFGVSTGPVLKPGGQRPPSENLVLCRPEKMIFFQVTICQIPACPGCQTLVCLKSPSAPVENKPRIKGQNKALRHPHVLQPVSGIILCGNVDISGRPFSAGVKPKKAETWPRFAKTWPPKWENEGALRHPPVGECLTEKYCCHLGLPQLVSSGCLALA